MFLFLKSLLRSDKKHARAVTIDHVIGIFMRIKQVSMCGAIDKLCLDGISKLYTMSESEGIQKELDEVRKRRIDPTN